MICQFEYVAPDQKVCANFETIHGFMSISFHNNQEKAEIRRLLDRIGPGRQKPALTPGSYAVGNRGDARLTNYQSSLTWGNPQNIDIEFKMTPVK